MTVQKVIKIYCLGKKEVKEHISTYEAVKLPAVIQEWCNNTISPGRFRCVCDVHSNRRLDKIILISLRNIEI